MLTPQQKEAIKNIFKQMFPKEQAEYESIMFDFGYAIASHDDESIKEFSSILVLRGFPEEQIKKLIEVFYK